MGNKWRCLKVFLVNGYHRRRKAMAMRVKAREWMDKG